MGPPKRVNIEGSLTREKSKRTDKKKLTKIKSRLQDYQKLQMEIRKY